MANRYLHGPVIDQILADEQVSSLTSPGDVLWPLTDDLGTVRDLAEHDGGTGTTTIVNHIKYDAFGGITAETNAAVDHLFAYTGREWDAEADLQYNRARWYDPAVGVWASEDPIGFASGDANLYRYVGNSATMFSDPSGLIQDAEPGDAGWKYDHVIGNFQADLPSVIKEPWRSRIQEQIDERAGRLFAMVVFATRCDGDHPDIRFPVGDEIAGFPMVPNGEIDYPDPDNLQNFFGAGPFGVEWKAKASVEGPGAPVAIMANGDRLFKYEVTLSVNIRVTLGTGVGGLPHIILKELVDEELGTIKQPVYVRCGGGC